MAKRVVFPLYDQPAGPGPLLSRYQLTLKAKSLVKVDGVWTEVITPSQDLLMSVGTSNFFLGGHVYILSDADAVASGLPAQYLEPA